MERAIEPLPPGTVLHDTFRIKGRLAEGGMGEIYVAAHTRLAGHYAVKVLSAGIVGKTNVYERFRREAEITSSLRHPHIVQIVDFNQLPDGRPYMVMEYLEGADLATRLHVEFALPARRASTIVEQVSSGLAAAHRLGITHRDLKPGNLFCVKVEGSDREFIKILDFGISKIKSATKITADATVLGTPRYMSPEQARAQGLEVDPLTDQFALGAIAYEMLSGRPAFDGADMTAVIHAVVNKAPPPLGKIAASLAELDTVVRKAMAKDKKQRYPTIGEFARAFEQAAARSAPSATPPGPRAGRGPDASLPLLSADLEEVPRADDHTEHDAATLSDKPKPRR